MRSDAARLAVRVLGAASLAALAVAIPVVLLVHVPSYTRALVLAVDAPRLSGLSERSATAAAEEVRRVVAGGPESALPERVDGRDAFGSRERAHLADVREVVDIAEGVALAGSLGAAVWLALSRGAGRERRAARSWGGATVLALAALAAAVGLSDFGSFFVGFHDVLFPPGTWSFAYTSLLVQLFPEAFWATSAGVWAGLTALAALALILTGRRQPTEEV